MEEATGKALNALKEIHVFSDVLAPDQLKQLARECRPSFFLAGSTLMAQGDFGNCMFCITDGLVSVSVVDPLERESEVTQLGPGGVVGEMALLTGDRRTATVTALTNVHALEVSKPALERIFARSPDLIENFGAMLALRQQALEQIAADPAGSMRAHFVKQIRQVFAAILVPRL